MINFVGKTKEEVKLNKELYETILELNSYQDAYDKMRSIDEINERIENRKALMKKKHVSISLKKMYKGEIKALKWVLNNSKTPEEYKSKLPRATKEDVKCILQNYRKRYKQMTIDDYEEDKGGDVDE